MHRFAFSEELQESRQLSRAPKRKWRRADTSWIEDPSSWSCERGRVSHAWLK